MTSWIGWIVTATLLTGAEGPPEAPAVPGDAELPPGWMPGACLLSSNGEPGPGSPYYAFDLVGTGRVPGTARAGGVARAAFASSPFGIAVTPDGSYVYDLLLEVEGLTEPRSGTFEVWITTPSLDRVEHQGTLIPGAPFRGSVSWNKFLVVVTLEPGDERLASGRAEEGPGEGPTDGATTWRGPVVLRGMSRSGMMHTMAGHGPFEQENCAAYGYED